MDGDGVSPVYSMAGVPGVPLPPETDSAFKMAEDLLGLIVTEMQSRGLTVPARRLIFPSPAVLDCEQVVVLIEAWTPDPPLDGFSSCSSFTWALTLQAYVARNTPAKPVPSGRGRDASPPSVDAMLSAALIASQDADALRAVVTQLGTVGPDLSVTMSPPEGGLQVTELNVQLPYTGITR